MRGSATSFGQIFVADIAQRLAKFGTTTAVCPPEAACRQHHVIERRLRSSAPYQFAEHASLHQLEVDARRITRWPASTIKLPFRKLNSILCGQLSSSAGHAHRQANQTLVGQLTIAAVTLSLFDSHVSLGSTQISAIRHFYERRVNHSAKLSTGTIANNTQGSPTLIYAMAPSAVPTKKPTPSGSSAINSERACV